jgi:hypothetical protein
MANDLTFTLTPNPTAVPLQDITLSVAPSANFDLSRYHYQWTLGGSNISGANQASYKFDASPTVGFTTYAVAVSAMAANNTVIFSKTTSNIIVRVLGEETSIFSRHLPKGANILNESGQERFARLRNLGYV